MSRVTLMRSICIAWRYGWNYRNIGYGKEKNGSQTCVHGLRTLTVWLTVMALMQLLARENMSVGVLICKFMTLIHVQPIFSDWPRNHCRLQLKCDSTRWRTGGEVKGKLANGVGSQYSHTTSEHGVSNITTADAHTSAASSRLNWRPRLFKRTRPFRRKTKSGFCTCAITFQNTVYPCLPRGYARAGPVPWYNVHADLHGTLDWSTVASQAICLRSNWRNIKKFRTLPQNVFIYVYIHIRI